MWNLNGTIAYWESERFRTRLDLACPAPGMTDVIWDRHLEAGAALMQMRLASSGSSMQLLDCYVRGTDVIASYTDSTRQCVLPEFYWRIHDEPTEAATVVIESLLSMQTPLLDSDPEVTVQCAMPADGYLVCHTPDDLDRSELMHTAQSGWKSDTQPIEVTDSGCAVVWRSPGFPGVLGQIIHPSDFSQAEVVRDASSRRVTSRVSVFPGRLEKGVIRRTRVQCVLTRSQSAASLLAQQWRDLLLAPPPLAT